MNSLLKTVQRTSGKILSVYYTAGFPKLEDTISDMQAMADKGVDFVELGMPFSDPLADGPVIQQASTQALANGMGLKRLFEQLKQFNGTLPLPVLLMGYLNPVLQYGPEQFCRDARQAGVAGLILPDVPFSEYNSLLKELMQRYGLHFVFLVTPTTPESRIREIDAVSTAFIYAVGASSTTGTRTAIEERAVFLRRLYQMKLKTPLITGFGINDQSSLGQAWKYTSGAITGTAYIRLRMMHDDPHKALDKLFQQLGIQPEKTI